GERAQQIEWLWRKLGLQPGHHLLDVTCGPGLYMTEMAKRGCRVTAVDFSPASIAYARNLAAAEGVAGRCTIIQQDIREFVWGTAVYDAAILLYGQLAVFTRAEAAAILAGIAQALKPGGKLVVELLNQERVDKEDSAWWFTDDTGLWGDAPFLHLGERFWHAEEATSVERFQILHLDTGRLDEILLCDQTYAVTEMVRLLKQAGFANAIHFPDWDGLPLYDAREWVVYLAEK
ncbi:MAG: SAM-dependent methyltransferase, partial [Anaerolineae bacterium]